MSSPDLSLSRPMAAAARLGAAAPDRHRFSEKRVLLRIGVDQFSDATARYTLLMALRLLARICRNVTVCADGIPAAVRGTLESEANRIAFGALIAFTPRPRLEDFDAILHVGSRREHGLPWTSIVTDGWLVQAATTGGAAHPALIQTPRAENYLNPVAAVMAASIGVTEIFKQLVGLKTERGGPANGSPFSCYTYTVSDDRGPAFPRILELDAALIGCGALGNGIVATLEPMSLTGSLLLVDFQDFASENLGTCVLLGPEDVGKGKAGAMGRRLSTHADLVIRTFEKDVMLLARETEVVPSMLLTALDSGDARRGAQLLWPDLIIDGAIGDFMAQVGYHPADIDADVACLRCVYSPDAETFGPRITAEAATGLPSDRLAAVDEPLTEEDIAFAAEDQRSWLRTNIGKPKCSVVSAAVARAIAKEPVPGFEPSTPFVACASAAMVVGELVRHAACDESPIGPRFQFDVLTGPQSGLDFGRGRDPRCECVARRSLIESVRSGRQPRPGSMKTCSPDLSGIARFRARDFD